MDNDSIHFFAETKASEVIEFYAITFIFDGKMWGINEPLIMKSRIKKASLEDFAALYRLMARGNPIPIQSGLFPTGSYFPSDMDIPILSLRSIWTEVWNV